MLMMILIWVFFSFAIAGLWALHGWRTYDWLDDWED